jgi:ubiquinone/menaquinone biosynthesis C-methylase UbiE
MASAQSFYTRWARLYDAVARHGPGVATLRARLAAALAPAPGDVVVEVGCGTGANFPYLRDRVGPAGTVLGVDFAPGPVALARRRVESAGWENVHVVRGDATRPPVEAADRLVAAFVVGMLDAPDDRVRDWAGLVRPGGRLALLDLAPSTRPLARPLNLGFRALVALSSPPGTRGRYDRSPTRVLGDRVELAHRALADVTEAVEQSTHALGFARLSAGRVP